MKAFQTAYSLRKHRTFSLILQNQKAQLGEGFPPYQPFARHINLFSYLLLARSRNYPRGHFLSPNTDFCWDDLLSFHLQLETVEIGLALQPCVYKRMCVYMHSLQNVLWQPPAKAFPRLRNRKQLWTAWPCWFIIYDVQNTYMANLSLSKHLRRNSSIKDHTKWHWQ